MKNDCLENLTFARKQLDCFGFILNDGLLDNFAASSFDSLLANKIDKIRPELHELYSIIDEVVNHLKCVNDENK